MIPGVLYQRPSDENFIIFPEALENAEVEMFSTTNSLFITLIIYFYVYSNIDYVSIGTSLSTSVIKYDTLWPTVKEPTEEISRLKPDFLFQEICKTSAN